MFISGLLFNFLSTIFLKASIDVILRGLVSYWGYTVAYGEFRKRSWKISVLNLIMIVIWLLTALIITGYCHFNEYITICKRNPLILSGYFLFIPLIFFILYELQNQANKKSMKG